MWVEYFTCWQGCQAMEREKRSTDRRGQCVSRTIGSGPRGGREL